MAEEDASDGGGRETDDDTVEEGRGIGEGLGPVITGGNMADYPGPLAAGLACRELGGEK